MLDGSRHSFRVFATWVHAREIADTIVFMASPQASYMNGASIIVDGGLTLMGAVANQER